MCGIVGVISRKNARDYEKMVRKALFKISHRGADDKSIYIDNNICFGYVRLAIRGLKSKYNQPIYFDNTISYGNGEVYSIKNRKVSRKENDLKPLIVNILRNKEKIYEYVDADFAVCIYDKKNSKVVLARDFFGVKPLYYCWIDDDTLVFSSELKGLKEIVNLNTINEQTVIDYLIFGYPIGNKTFYKNVYCLPAKTIFEWDLKSNVKNYFSGSNDYIKYTKRNTNIYYAIKKSVNNRMISDRKVGAHLSGGYDSSLISYISRDKIDYITAYNSLEDKDLMVSNIITDDIKARHTIIRLNTNIDYEELIDILSSPMMSTGIFVPYEISRVSSLYNKKVLLAGQGADELFLGYKRFDEIKNISKYTEVLNIVSNSDLDMLSKLFNGFCFRDKYVDVFKSNNILKTTQLFYIENFLAELLHIEDCMHMNFGIENRVPFLSLEIIKYIKKYGICISNKQNKNEIYNANKTCNSKALIRNSKENMNRDLLIELKKIDYSNFFKIRVFDNFNYRLFSNYLNRMDKLNKKQLFTIWFIYNIYLWYKINEFDYKIRMV